MWVVLLKGAVLTAYKYMKFAKTRNSQGILKELTGNNFIKKVEESRKSILKRYKYYWCIEKKNLRKDKKHYFRLSIFIARVAELVDASVSKTDNRKVVPVRFRSWVLLCSLSLKFECVLFKTPHSKLQTKTQTFYLDWINDAPVFSRNSNLN